MRTYSTAELWGRIANDDKGIAREALRSALLGSMRANTRVLWGAELIAVASTPEAYNLGMSAGARLIDGTYFQTDAVGSFQCAGVGSDLPSLLPSGEQAALPESAYATLSCAYLEHRGGPVCVCVPGIVQPSYAQIRSALQNGDVGWDRFSGLVLGRALFGLLRRATITLVGPFVAGEVFTVEDADSATVMTYTVQEGDDAADVVAGLEESMDDARFVFANAGVGVFTLDDNLLETGPLQNVNGLVGSTDSVAGTIGLGWSDAVSALVWTYESERQCAGVHEPEPLLFGTPEP